jgi:hypothetical protein
MLFHRVMTTFMALRRRRTTIIDGTPSDPENRNETTATLPRSRESQSF